jgi:type II secretory pathway pseudopilin PulG
VSRWSAFLATTILCATLALLASSPAQASTTLAKLRHARHDLRAAQHRLTHYRDVLRALVAAQASGTGSQDDNVSPPLPAPEATASPAPEAAPDPTTTPSSSSAPLPEPVPDVTQAPDASPSAAAGLDVSAGADLSQGSAATATSSSSLTTEQLRAKIVKVKKRIRRLTHRVHTLRHRLYVERSTARGYYVPLIADVSARTGVSAYGLRHLMLLESGGRASAVGGGGLYLGLYQYSRSTWGAAWNRWRSSSIFDPAAQIRATARAVRLGYGPSLWPNTYWRVF